MLVKHVVMYVYTAEEKQHVQKVRFAKSAARSIQIKIWQTTVENRFGYRQKKLIRKNMTVVVLR